MKNRTKGKKLLAELALGIALIGSLSFGAGIIKLFNLKVAAKGSHETEKSKLSEIAPPGGRTNREINDAEPGARSRTARLGRRATRLMQSGCTASLAPTSQSFPASGGNGSVAVTVVGDCNWTATKSASWLTITSGSNGSGNGTVNYSVAANSGALSRSAIVTIAGQGFTVSQSSANGTQTDHWSQRNSGTTSTLNAVHFITENEGWVAGANATLLHTTDGGITWESQTTGISPVSSLNSVRFLNQKIGWVGSAQALARTKDGGVTWNVFPFTNTGGTQVRNRLFPVSSASAWAVGGGTQGSAPANFHFRYDVAADGTLSTAISSATASASALQDVCFIDPNNGWSVGAGGLIVRIASASSDTPTFTNQTSGTSQSLDGIHMLDANYGWVVGDHGTILKTTNGGANWTPQSSGTTAHLRSVHFLNVQRGWAVGDGGLILTTNDGGATWAPEPSGVTTDLRGVSFDSAGVGYAVGAGGTILKRITVQPPPSQTNSLAVDDGSFEDFRGLTNGGTSYRVNRLTPASYPATLSAVSIFFGKDKGVQIGDALTVVVGTNSGGATNINGVSLQPAPATVHALDQFNLYDVPDVTINAGDFVVGYFITHEAGVMPFALDQTPPSKRRSYRSVDGGLTFQIIDNVGSGPGNYGIRAILGQASTACTYTILPSSKSFGPASGTGSVEVATPSNCNWTATSNAPWLTINSGASGSGNGTVNYTVATNDTSSQRSGTLTIAGQTFTVNQNGPNPAPTLTSLSPNSANAGDTGVMLTVQGTGFVNGSIVRWNGADRATTFVSATQLTASITEADVANLSTASVTVFSPSPGGGTSNALTFTINGVVDLELTKSHAGSFSIGANGVYTLTVKNVGSAASTSTTTVTDILPAGLSFVSATGADWSCSATGQTVTCTNSSPLAVNASSTITLTVGVSSAAAPGVTNTAIVANARDLNPLNDTAKDPTTIGAVVDLAIAKSHTGNFTAGSNGVYTLTVTNAGTVSTSGTITVVDTLPNGLSFVSGTGSQWSCAASGQMVTCTNLGPLGAGASSAITLTVGVSGATAPSVTNIATVSVTGDANPTNNSASDPTTVICAFAISPTSQSFTAGAGTGSVTVSTASGCAWAASSNATWLTVTAGSSGSGNGTVNYSVAANTSTSSRTGTLTVAGQTFTITQAGATPAPTITSLSPASATAGGPAFTLTVNGTNFVSGSTVLWNGADRTTSFLSATQLTASITAADIVNVGSASISVRNPASGGISNAVSFAINGTVDLAIAKTHTGNFTAGSNGVYTLTVKNVGSAASTGTITVTDPLPIGLSFVSGTGTGWNCSALGGTVTCTNSGSLAAGASSTITLTVAVSGAASPSVTNTATVATSGDANPANNSAPDPTTVICAFTISPTSQSFTAGAGTGSVTVSTASGCSWAASSNATWLTITSGSSGAGNGTVNYSVAANTSTSSRTGTLTVAGQTFTVTQAGATPAPTITSLSPASATAGGPAFTLTVNGTNFVSSSTVLWNGADRATNFLSATQLTASITAADIAAVGSASISVRNPASGGTSNAVSFAINGAADLTLTKTHTGNFTAGTNGVYTLTVKNVGTASSSGTITVTDTLPASLSFVSGTGTGWSCAASGQMVTCTNPAALGVNTSSTITLTVSVSGAAGPTITNMASVANASDANPANNSASDVTTVACAYTISPISQSFTAEAGTGSVTVSTASGCSWIATSNAIWLTITSGSSGSGNGTVNYSVAANTSTSPRTGTLTVAGQTFTVSQGGSNCLYTLSPDTQFFESDGGGGAATVLAPNGCSWTAVSNDAWITVVTGTGSGSDNLTFNVAPNPSVETRTGTLTVAGKTLTIIQAGIVAVVSGASYSRSGLASEAVVSAFGTGLASGVEAAKTIPLPTALLGTTVKMRDSTKAERLAPLFFVSPGQVNYQIPPETSAGLATVIVTSGNGKTGTTRVQIVEVSPGLFTANADGQGIPAAVALRVKKPSTAPELVYEDIARYDPGQGRFVASPIDLGADQGADTDQVYLILFGTGFRHRSSLSAATVQIGGEDAQVLYAGAQGGLVGTDQINLLLPRSLIGRGEVDLVLTVDGLTANTVKIQIK